MLFNAFVEIFAKINIKIKKISKASYILFIYKRPGNLR